MTLAEAVRRVAKSRSDLSNEAIVECYPSSARYPSNINGTPVFAYQFMTKAGRNIATYIPCMESVIFHGELGRQYSSMLQKKFEDISAFLPE